MSICSWKSSIMSSISSLESPSSGFSKLSRRQPKQESIITRQGALSSQFNTGQESLSLCSAQSPSRKPQRDSWHQEDQRHHHSCLHESLITSRGSKIFSITSIYSLPLTFLNHSWFPLLIPDLYKVAPSSFLAPIPLPTPFTG